MVVILSGAKLSRSDKESIKKSPHSLSLIP